MKMAEFIKQFRTEIDAVIDSMVGHVPKTAGCYCPLSGTNHYHQPERRNDAERRQWIVNHEGLYDLARRAGVKV